MKNIAGSLNYDTKMDTKGIDKGLKDIDSKSQKVAGSMQVALGNIVADLAIAAANGLKEIAKAGIEYNAQIETYQTALTTLLGSAEEANKVIAQIKEDAAKTPFDVNGLVKANQLLISAGVDASKSRKDILALGNAISATGGGSAELERMAVNLQQIKNVGKASALDIKQFAYAGIDLYGLLADSMGITREEATELEVTYEQVTEALQYASEEGGQYFGAMEKQSKTFNGQISNLKDNLSSLLGEKMKPLFDFISNDVLPAINALIQGEGDVSEITTEIATKVMDFILNTIETLIENLPRFIQIGIDIISSLMEGIANKLPELMVTSVNTVIQTAETIINNLDKIIDAGVKILLALVNGIVEALPQLIDKIPDIITDLFTAIIDNLPTIVAAGLELLLALAKGLIESVPKLLEKIPEILKDIYDEFVKKIKEIDWAQLGKDIVNGIGKGIKSVSRSIGDGIKYQCGRVKTGFKQIFGIESPSKVMRDEVGKQLTAGIAVGIEADSRKLDDSIESINEDIIDKMRRTMIFETGELASSGTNGTITQMLSAYGTTTVINDNKLFLDGDEIYENQQQVSARKNLESQFGGGYSVSA